MAIQYTSTTIPLLVVTVLLISLAAYAWNKRQIPGAKVFILLMVDLALWSLGHLGEWVFVDFELKFIALRTQYFFIATVPILWLLFTLETTGHGRYIRTRNIIYLLIVPMTTFIGIWTNSSHKLFWPEIGLGLINNASILQSTLGPWFWVHATYSYLVLIAGSLVLLQAYQRSSHLYRRQLLLLLIGSFIPWIANAITIFRIVPAWAGLDLTPFGFYLTGLTMAWGLFRYQLLDIVPIARDIIFERMTEGVIVLNVNQQIVDVNPAAESEMLISSAEIVGKSASEVLSPWFKEIKLLEDGSSTQNEISIQLPDDKRHFIVSTSPLKVRRQPYSGWVMVFQEITERKKMEQEIIQARDDAVSASNLKTRLLANVSHDLRTPLGSILGFTEMLQAGVPGEVNEKQYKILTDIIDSTEQLLTFVNNLIGQAQLDSGKFNLNIQEINPKDLISAFQSTATALARAKKLDLQLQVDPEMPPVVKGDLYWLRQIILNLVSNAVKFTDSGAVAVEIMSVNDQFWAIKVTDTGGGISEKYHNQIFEPFTQAENQALEKIQSQGSGLGLSIVQQLSTLMGGRVHLESELGEGSTFTVFLPWNPLQGEPQ